MLDASVEDVWNVIRDWSKFAWIDKVRTPEPALEVMLSSRQDLTSLGTQDSTMICFLN